MASSQVIRETKKQILVADASVYTPTKGANNGVEVVSLTYLDYGKPNYITLPVSEAKKFFQIIPGGGREGAKSCIGQFLEVKTTISTL